MFNEICTDEEMLSKNIYSNVHIYIQGAYDKFPDFFRMGILNCRRLLKNHCYCCTSYEMTDQFL